jgi:hypothetical protein
MRAFHPRPATLPLRGLVLAAVLAGLAAACGPRTGSDVPPARDTAAMRTDTAAMRTDTAATRTDTSHTSHR